MNNYFIFILHHYGVLKINLEVPFVKMCGKFHNGVNLIFFNLHKNINKNNYVKIIIYIFYVTL
jgi:hypothetical protein